MPSTRRNRDTAARLLRREEDVRHRSILGGGGKRQGHELCIGSGCGKYYGSLRRKQEVERQRLTHPLGFGGHGLGRRTHEARRNHPPPSGLGAKIATFGRG